MKIVIALCIISVGFFALAQNGKGNDKSDKGNSKHIGKQKIQPVKGTPKVKKILHPGKGSNDIKPVTKGKSHPNHVNRGNGNKGFKPKQFHYKKGHSNHIYMYHFGPMVYPTKNYGQWRSQQARNKHRKYKPKAEKDALSAIVMINNRNSFLMIEIGRKIDRYEQLVLTRRQRGVISDIEFSIRMSSIRNMRSRHNQFSMYLAV